MIDMDYRAILCTRMGLKSNNLSAQTVIGDGTEDLPPNNYDLVVSNPPTHAGSVKLRELFEGMVRVMRIEGKMLIVLRQHLNYEKWLSELGQVDTLSVEKGYKMPAIIGDVLWEAAQDRRKTARTLRKKNGKWLLQGLVMCGNCGHRYYCYQKDDKHRRTYQCYGRTKAFHQDGMSGVKTAPAWVLIGSRRQSGIPSRKPLAIMSYYEKPMKLDSRY